ncbi:MAG: hypothetical protein LBT14_09790 [Treponema sp.]|nr:hypothetical protein [Treponema sp.]
MARFSVLGGQENPWGAHARVLVRDGIALQAFEPESVGPMSAPGIFLPPPRTLFPGPSLNILT